MAYPSSVDTFTIKVDGIDSYLAAHMNAVQSSITATQTELGTGLKGTLGDLATRLAVGLNADGTVKPSGLSSLPNNIVTTLAILNQAVTAAKIANATITAAQIANLTLTAALMVDGTITGTKIGSAQISTSHLVDLNVTGAKVADATLDGRHTGLNTGGNVVGSIPIVHQVVVPDAATGDVDIVVTHQVRVIGVRFVKTVGAGAAGNTIQVKNGANAITDAMDTNVADKVVVRNAQVDDAFHLITAGGTLRVTRTKVGGDASGLVYVECVRV
jgi:hypothetical protein